MVSFRVWSTFTTVSCSTTGPWRALIVWLRHAGRCRWATLGCWTHEPWPISKRTFLPITEVRTVSPLSNLCVPLFVELVWSNCTDWFVYLFVFLFVINIKRNWVVRGKHSKLSKHRTLILIRLYKKMQKGSVQTHLSSNKQADNTLKNDDWNEIWST